MVKKYATVFKWMNVITDYILFNFFLYIGFIIQDTYWVWTYIPDDHKLNLLLLNLFWFYCSNLVGLYDNIINRKAVLTIRAIVLALALYFAGPIILKIVIPGFSLPLNLFIFSFLGFAVSIFLWKFLFLVVRKFKRNSLIGINKVVIIGAGPTGIDLFNYFLTNPGLGYEVDGFFDDPPVPAQNYKVLGKIEDCFNYAKNNNVYEIYCALSYKDVAKIEMLKEEADKHMIRFRLVPDVKEFYDKNVMIEYYGPMPILSPRLEPLENKANEILKRAFDIGFSLLVIVFLLSWLIPLMALVIKLESKGPVFFKQLRSGKDNKPFFCLKLRSMYVNADSDYRQASKGDNRITRVGAFIRKTSIDELPQFWNVLMGEMSVVGPRPHMIKQTEDYSILINEYMVRQFLTPGISGWAQVNGFRGETKDTMSMKKRVQADIWYLENWSLLLDFKIIFLTIWKALRGDQNAF